MFVNLFISKWRHPNASIRILAVSKLNPGNPADSKKLCQLATHDPDPEVQAAAITRLDSLSTLVQLLELTGHSHRQDLAAHRIAELYKHQLVAVEDLAQLNQEAMTKLLCVSREASLHEQLGQHIDQQPLLAELAMRAALAATRQYATKQLTEEHWIDVVRAHAKEHDKAVYRIIREQLKLKQLQLAEQQATEEFATQLLSQLGDLLSQHQRQQKLKHLSARVEHIHQQWQERCTEANPIQQSQWQSLMAQLNTLIQAQKEQAAQMAAVNTQLDTLEQSLTTYIEHFPDQVAQDTKQLEQLAKQLDNLKPAQLSEEQTKRHENCEAMIMHCQAFPDQLTELSELKVHADKALSDEDINSLIIRANRLLQQMNKGSGLFPYPAHRQTAETLIDTLQQKKHHLQALHDDRLEQEQQHQRDIIRQKEQLCIAMEVLIDLEQPAQDKAQQIKTLQQQWKQLDQQTSVAVKGLWDRFHQASQQAYAPCEQHFREQSKLRAWNLAQRQEICEALETYFATIDWDQVDWPALEHLLKKAKLEWRDYAPVDRAPGKALQNRFNVLIKQADQAVKNYRQHCAQAKQQLIDEATELAQVPESEFATATERLKELQAEWKHIDPAEHTRERQLWKAFRHQGDVLFSRLRAHQQPEQQPSEEMDARLLCVRLEILLNQPSPEADQYLRMEYQMERLEEALETPTADEVNEALAILKKEWQASEFGENFPALNQRFQQLLNQHSS